MGLEILTKEDLEVFRLKLIEDLREIISEVKQFNALKPEGYKTSDVRKMLGCSVNKLVGLRVSRQIRAKKIGGTLYYNSDDVKRLLDEGY